ncbi:MAG: glucose-6-phosphate isomerase [Bacillota bacterium]
MAALSSSPAWQALLLERDALEGTHISQLWDEDPGRGESLTFGCAGLVADFSKQRVNARVLEALLALARERDVPGAIERLFAGARVNATENRPALHTALRGEEHVVVDESDILPEVQRHRERMRVFSTAVRDGLWKGATGKRFTHVIAIGIGGSALGPRLVTEALAAEADGPQVRYIANVDPAELDDALAGLDPESTLVVIASKTFTTQETMANAKSAREWLERAMGGEAIAKHVVAATANTEAAVRWGLPECNVFAFSEWVGGRYSVWSSVGMPAAIALGMPRFEQLLAGAHAADLAFRSDPLERNVAVLLALIGVWNRNALAMPTHAVLAYASRLQNLTAYLQQLEMESLGKRVDAEGNPLEDATCPVIWGGVGTPGQHAYHQWLHQGTDAVSCDFIVVAKPMGESLENHEILLSHACAQSEALMTGRATPQSFKACPGDRPSTTLVMPSLDAYHLGALIAMFEHKVYVQATLWGIDAFDQWGVELGKQIAGQVLPAVRGADATLHPATHHLLSIIHKLGTDE